MNNLVKGLELNIKLNTEEIDRAIAEEIEKNLTNDINDLIKEYYNTYNDEYLIQSRLIPKNMTIEDFKIGDVVRVTKIVGEDSIVSVGSIGTVVDVDGAEYPINCNFDNVKDYGFKPEELEII
ncbi:hypothetical protein [uncultured Clostridium sp.]|uniref:hypothetical protein n=1 Tax=uncultured Clostridium sp. TaxID=59620 RepID=UPI003217F9D3